jgi:hypothetical protein
MEPRLFGRKLGIGLRVASRMVRQRTGSSSPTPITLPATATLETNGKSFAQKGNRVAEGSKRFGKAFFGPLGHVASVLWLQITGVFFALFALFFLQSLWKIRWAYATGSDHKKFWLYAALSVIFLYFCISSFFRARRKERRRT